MCKTHLGAIFLKCVIPGLFNDISSEKMKTSAVFELGLFESKTTTRTTAPQILNLH